MSFDSSSPLSFPKAGPSSPIPIFVSSEDEEPAESSGGEVFEVESILSIRLKGGHKQYLVKWKNYPLEESTWEPVQNLSGCSELLQAFEKEIQTGTKRAFPKSATDKPNGQRVWAKASTDAKSERVTLCLPSKKAKFSKLSTSPSKNIIRVKIPKAQRGPEPYSKIHLEAWEKLLAPAVGPKISVVNDVDDAGPPSDFTYINSHRYHPNAQPLDDEFLAGCTCKGKCKSGKGCSCLGNNDDLATYDSDGRYMFPGNDYVIYECNHKCSCDKTCPNRVIQHGIKIKMQIFRTNGRGWGVRTMEKIPANTFVATYVGEIITNEEAERRGVTYDSIGRTYLFDMDKFLDPMDVVFTIDAYHYGNISHFFNHSCDPNLKVIAAFTTHNDIRMHDNAFFAIRDIEVGEELTFDYSGGNASRLWSPRAKKAIKRKKTKKVKSDGTAANKIHYEYKRARFAAGIQSV